MSTVKATHCASAIEIASQQSVLKGASINDVRTGEGGGQELPKFADKQYRADGVDGPEEMERS